MSWGRLIGPAARVVVGRIAAGAALTAAIAGGVLIPTLQEEEALGDGRGRLVYIDPVGIKTWCYGDTGPVPAGPLTPAVCEAQLNRRVKELCTPVANAIKVPVYVEEMVALCSWAYNVGPTAAINSTVLRELNKGNYAAVPRLLLAWKYAQGRDCTIRSNNCYGMWTRRQREAAMFAGAKS